VAEYFEVECPGFPSPARYLERLNRLLPTGFVVREGFELAYTAPALNEVLDATTYRVQVPGGVDATAPGLTSFRQRPVWPVKVARKGKPKILDARRCLRDAQVTDGELRVTIAFSRTGTMKIGEAVALLLGEEVARTAQVHKEAVTLSSNPISHELPPEVSCREPAVDLTAFSDRRSAEASERSESRPPFAED
jgi:hypothetical protein